MAHGWKILDRWGDKLLGYEEYFIDNIAIGKGSLRQGYQPKSIPIPILP